MATSPAADLLGKAFNPLVLDIRATDLNQHGPLQELGGEAWVLVLEGRVRVLGGVYAPTELGAGDSLYFDARAGFALLQAGDGPARALLVVDGRGG
jgi:hypothetical protein